MSEHNEALQKENVELKHQNAVKSDLISISAHQLRTSLSAMKWILKMFLDGDFGDLSDEQKNLIQKAFDSDERMIRLVNEMLSINHAEDTLEAIHPSTFDLVQLVDEVLFDFIGESHKRNIQVILLKPEDHIPEMTADKEKIRVVLQNLIENAIKYSDSHTRVLVNIRRDGENILLSVRDSGIGIPSQDQLKIFGKFFRAENARKKDNVGSGLGLYTTKRIIEKHGGKIRFESSESGTTFHITLPIGQK